MTKATLTKPVAAMLEHELNRARLLKKKCLAEIVGCSTRQIELMIKAGKIPAPFYVGDASPRWRPEDIDAWLSKLSTEAQQADRLTSECMHQSSRTCNRCSDMKSEGGAE